MIRRKLSNLKGYFKIDRDKFLEADTCKIYDPDDPMNYYLSQSHKAIHRGPLDDNGIPLYVHNGNPGYFHIYISMYALGNLELSRKTGQVQYRDIFRNMVDYFLSTQEEDGTWIINLKKSKVRLEKPWVSAMAQGLAISCLTRAYMIYSDDEFLEAAIKALLPFHRHIDQGGVSFNENGFIFFEEFPNRIQRHVLNGFIIAMWGLLDLARLKKESDSRQLFDEGVKTLLEFLPNYDMGYWSLYNLSDYGINPASLEYHKLHIAQLDVLYGITGIDRFKEFRDLWRTYLNSRFNAYRTLPRKILWNLKYGV